MRRTRFHLTVSSRYNREFIWKIFGNIRKGGVEKKKGKHDTATLFFEVLHARHKMENNVLFDG
jgi:hypothetical protein